MAVEQLITQHIDTWTSALRTRSTAGRGTSGKIELYGIKKLRELILELAVRGKLVPQDPNDEPASELLKRIAAEKAELVKQGKIKKQKPLPEISEEEKPFDLPSGWDCARLGNTVAIIRGITFPASEKHKEPSEGKIACLRTANVQDNIEWDDLLYVSKSFVKRSEQFAEKGDIVMSMANSRELVGKVAFIYNVPNGEATFGGFLSVIRPYGFNASFLMSLLRSPHIKSILIDSSSQTTNIANISLEKLNPLVIAVPPFEEQNRIASKLEELMSLCDQLEQQSLTSLEAHYQLVETLLSTLPDSQNAEELAENWARISQHFDTLFTTEASIDALKQTILQLAIMGKLVPQDPNDEPASELLKRIEQEKAQLVKEGKIKKQKPLPAVSDDEKPFELPEGWEWVRLPDLGDLARGKSKHRPRNDPAIYIHGTYPLVQTGDVSRSNGVITTYTALYNELGVKQSKIWPKGTLCITIAANIADSGILTFDACFPDSVVGYVPHITDMPIKYFDFFMRTMKSSLEKYAPSTAQKNINLDILGQVLVPCPPLNEFGRIVHEVETLFTLCDTLKSRLQSSQQTQLHLADALTEAALN